MTFTSLMSFLITAVSTFVSFLNGVRLAGIPLMALLVFFAVLCMVLVIVFRVRTGDLFDGMGGRRK